MKYLAVFFFTFVSNFLFAQQKEDSAIIKGVIKDDTSGLVISSVNVINVNTVKGVVTNDQGEFSLMAFANDTLHISLLGYKSIKVKVTNDWIKNKSTTIQLTQKAYALEEVVVRQYVLTGYLEIDAKLIPTRENYRYSISGLPEGYEAGEYSPNAFGRVLGSIFNPADMLYNFFGKKPKELRRLKEMKKDDTVKNLLASKFDRETISALLGVTKSEIAEIMERCNYSEAFVKTANDLQIMDAISACYEEYKILKRK
ncbi:carboxypeptidase-like regulatory domain-containing protein [Flavobacterium antarcticum]|uniref:carboxypeptidase-like regulatory domain-containing protein n=1 Tax=Flavobacterium antarcticum TaxID=271155 RepID=UPI0003B303C1|nr:carboxypeptidase-like regulatory domain-containing protein [Flavobacterium antarcticum]